MSPPRQPAVASPAQPRTAGGSLQLILWPGGSRRAPARAPAWWPGRPPAADAPTGRAVARAATRARTMATGTARVTGTVNVTGTARATEVADGVPDKRSQLPMVLWQRRCGPPVVGGGESLP